MRATGRIAHGAGHEVQLVPMNSDHYPDVAYTTRADYPDPNDPADVGGRFAVSGIPLDHAPLRVFTRDTAMAYRRLQQAIAIYGAESDEAKKAQGALAIASDSAAWKEAPDPIRNLTQEA